MTLHPDRDRLAALFLELAALRSPSREERAVADLVLGRLSALGLTVEEDATGEAIGGSTGNLYCLVRGDGEKPVLALGAHLDTVRPTSELRPVLEEGIFRNAGGTILGADNKTAVAALLHVTELLVASGEPFPTYELCFTVAEELGLVGAKHLPIGRPQAPMAVMFDSTGPIGGVVVKAPTQQNIRATFRGKAAHAGLEPEKGRNAIVAAAKAIALMELGRLDGETTANVGVIHGGIATNIVAEVCEVTAECRSIDEAKVAQVSADILQAFQTGAAQMGVDVETVLTPEYRAFSLTGRSPVVQLTRAAFAELGLQADLHASGGGSDANILNERGIPTVNLSCGMLDVHTAEESLPLSDLETLVRLIGTLVRLAPGYARS